MMTTMATITATKTRARRQNPPQSLRRISQPNRKHAARGRTPKKNRKFAAVEAPTARKNQASAARQAAATAARRNQACAATRNCAANSIAKFFLEQRPGHYWLGLAVCTCADLLQPSRGRNGYLFHRQPDSSEVAAPIFIGAESFLRG